LKKSKNIQFRDFKTSPRAGDH